LGFTELASVLALRGGVFGAGLMGRGSQGNFHWMALWRNSWRHPL